MAINLVQVPQRGPTCWAHTSAHISQHLLWTHLEVLFDNTEIELALIKESQWCGITHPNDLARLGPVRVRSANNGDKLFAVFRLKATEVKASDVDVNETFVYLQRVGTNFTHSAIIRSIRKADPTDAKNEEVILNCSDPNGVSLTLPKRQKWRIMGYYHVSFAFFRSSSERLFDPAVLLSTYDYAGCVFFAIKPQARALIKAVLSMPSGKFTWGTHPALKPHAELGKLWMFPTRPNLHRICVLGTFFVTVMLSNNSILDPWTADDLYAILKNSLRPKPDFIWFKKTFLNIMLERGILFKDVSKSGDITYKMACFCVGWLQDMYCFFGAFSDNKTVKTFDIFSSTEQYVIGEVCTKINRFYDAKEEKKEDNNNSSNSNNSFDYFGTTPPKQTKPSKRTRNDDTKCTTSVNNSCRLTLSFEDDDGDNDCVGDGFDGDNDWHSFTVILMIIILTVVDCIILKNMPHVMRKMMLMRKMCFVEQMSMDVERTANRMRCIWMLGNRLIRSFLGCFIFKIISHVIRKMNLCNA
eukprot:352425_1